MSKNNRMTFTLNRQMCEDLSYLSGRLRVSRSAIVVQLFSDALHDFAELVAQVPESPTNTDIVRMRGDSARVISERLASYQQAAAALDAAYDSALREGTDNG
jgi:hypothetical protein